MISVLDVGAPQGLITPFQYCALAQSSVRGIFARCGNGNDAPDKTFAANVDGTRGARLAPGAYGVGFPLPDDDAHPGRDPVSQALAHFKASGGLGANAGELPPALDLEWPMPIDWPKWKIGAKFVRTWGLSYLTTTERLCGRVPILYLYPDFAVHLFEGASDEELAAFAHYRLWLARYGAAQPGTIAPWTAPTIWQKSDGGGRLPSGAPVDQDEFIGDEDAWEELLAA